MVLMLGLAACSGREAGSGNRSDSNGTSALASTASSASTDAAVGEDATVDGACDQGQMNCTQCVDGVYCANTCSPLVCPEKTLPDGGVCGAGQIVCQCHDRSFVCLTGTSCLPGSSC
jgi:hypothetical protein